MDAARDMATFQALARTGTISSAAHELGVAPSAVSRRLKALEARLGTELVRRSTRALVLTPAGEAYLERSKKLLSSIDALEEEMREESLGIAGPIKLAAPLSFGLGELPGPIERFLSEHPAVTLELDLRDDQVDLVREGFDLALRIGELAASSLIAKRICRIPIQLGASERFLKAHGNPKSPDELEGLPGLVYANAQRGDVLRYKTPDGEEGRVQLTRRVIANNGDMLASLAAGGHGLYHAPDFIMRRYFEDGSLLRLFGDHDWGQVSLQAVWPPTHHQPVRVRTLIDFLATELSRSPKA
jgi:DNA-binding transcriptional LysR family regulator